MSDAWIVWLAVGGLFLVACGALAFAWDRGRLGVASIVLLVVSLAAWALALAAISSGYRDADGWVDCRDSCTAVQRAAATGFLGPPLLVALAALGMLGALLGRWLRLRRERGIRENPTS